MLPTFDYVGHSDRLTWYWLNQYEACALVEVDRWADKGVTEACVTHKVSVICRDADARRLGGQKLFKFGTEDAQLRFMTFMQTRRNEFVNIPPCSSSSSSSSSR